MKIVLAFFGMLVMLGCQTQSAREPQLDKEVVVTQGAPKAIGPYSQAIRVGNTLYLSGQIAIDPGTGEMVGDDIQAQTRQVLDNIQAVLDDAGFSLSDVVQSKVFLADLNDYAAMNEVYGAYFKEHPPARAAVQVARLPLDALVEIMVTAVRLEHQ